MTKEKDRVRLKQEVALQRFLIAPASNQMLTVYEKGVADDFSYDHLIYCSLIPHSYKNQCLSQHSWDLKPDEGIPQCSYSMEGETQVASYHRFGQYNFIEPLIICRSFNELRPSYREISEEFRHFHNLYHDTKENKYLKFDECGNEKVVAIITENKIEMSVLELRQFLSIKEMHLSIQFEFSEHSHFSLSELKLDYTQELNESSENYCWHRHYTISYARNMQSVSYVCGKSLINSLPKEKSKQFGYSIEEEKKYESFITGVDESGDEILSYSGPNLDFDFLTPVYFRKEVLEKYYADTKKYSVHSSGVGCGDLWGISIDNYHKDKVCAWLGDLGRLPYCEQSYWKSYNIQPQGTMSREFLSNQIRAIPTDNNQVIDIFFELHDKLSYVCYNNLKWSILRPLREEDQHHIRSIRIPSSNNQKIFDELILSLTKILIDSLNEEKLNALFKDKIHNCNGGINRIEKIFQELNIEGYESHIIFLRNLQSLRSKGSAHRKGKEYKAAAKNFGIDTMPFNQVYIQILDKANHWLDFLITLIQNGKFSI